MSTKSGIKPYTFHDVCQHHPSTHSSLHIYLLMKPYYSLLRRYALLLNTNKHRTNTEQFQTITNNYYQSPLPLNSYNQNKTIPN